MHIHTYTHAHSHNCLSLCALVWVFTCSSGNVYCFLKWFSEFIVLAKREKRARPSSARRMSVRLSIVAPTDQPPICVISFWICCFARTGPDRWWQHTPYDRWYFYLWIDYKINALTCGPTNGPHICHPTHAHTYKLINTHHDLNTNLHIFPEWQELEMTPWRGGRGAEYNREKCNTRDLSEENKEKERERGKQQRKAICSFETTSRFCFTSL